MKVHPPFKRPQPPVTHRKCLQEDQTLYNALHGVASETKCARQVASLTADGGCRQRGVHQGALLPLSDGAINARQRARQRRSAQQTFQRIHIYALNFAPQEGVM